MQPLDAPSTLPLDTGSTRIRLRTPVQLVVLLLLSSSACLADEVQLRVRLLAAGRRLHLEVRGPSRSPFAILVSPADQGAVLRSGQALTVSFMEPARNILHAGELDERGRATREVALPIDAPGFPARYFLQAVALPSGKLDGRIQVSPPLCLEKGPPPRVVRVTDRRGWYALLFLLPLLGLVSAPRVRRHPMVLSVLPAAALTALLLHPGPIRRPVARFAAHGFDSDAARDRLLGPDVHRALKSAARLIPKQGVVWIPPRHAADFFPALYTTYFLAPRRVRYGDPARLVRGFPETDEPIYCVTGDPAALPPGVHAEPISGLSLPDVGLYRVRRR
jgi:hypothetical protein